MANKVITSESNKYMIICVRSRQGFFTNFLQILQYLNEADHSGLIPIVHWEGGIYSAKDNVYNGIRSKNIWDYFFEPVSDYSVLNFVNKYDLSKWGNIRSKIPECVIVSDYKHISETYEPPYCWTTRLYPPDICLNNPTQEARYYVNKIISKYIKLKPWIQEKITSFFDLNFHGKNVLGVHIRGCKEAERQQGHKFFIRYVKHVRKYLESNPDAEVYLATDHVSYLEKMIKEFGNKILFRDAKRSNNEHAVQYGCRDKKKFIGGGAVSAEEAITDCWMLSMCSYLIRGFSNLPSVSSYINPGLNVFYACRYNDDDKKFLGIGDEEYIKHLRIINIESRKEQ